MIGKTISHYNILEKLGSGGMGVVYKAEDTKLRRHVALKFLPTEFTRDDEAKRRFIREAQAASALQHHNICTIHEIDETPDGQLFIAMDFYEGETLKERITRCPLSLEETLGYTIQAAEGLTKAHEAGMVHRDIKPANIMVTRDGVVKILDFGLAKLAELTKLTQPDRTPGTPSYMSPEQAKGDEVDERSDIFSLGVVLYELISGRRAFRGDYQAAVLYEVVHENPVPLSDSRPEVPRELEQVVNKALEKDPGKRYQRSEELLSDLQLIHAATAKGPAVKAPFIAKVPLWKRLRPSILWTTGIVIAAFITAVLILFPRPSVPFTERDWILITDLKNLTGDELFDRSLNMALAISIQQSRYVNVYPRPRINETLKRMGKPRGDTLDVILGSEVAQREGIRALVVPTISSIGNEYVLSASIVDPYTLLDMKTQMVRAEGKGEVLDALGDLAEKIRKDLGESLPSIARRNVRLPEATTSSLEALKKFSEGAWTWGYGRYDDAVALWQEAVELDSSFAWAHASLGMCYYWYYRRPEGDKHFNKALSLLDQTTEREKLWIRSLIESSRGNYTEAILHSNLFLSRFPDDLDAWYNLGNYYMRIEQYEKALEAYKKTLALDPHMASAYANIATVDGYIGRYDDAIENYERAFEKRPEWITLLTLNHEYGFAYVRIGDFQKAREIFQLMLSESDEKRAMGYRSLGLLDMYLGKCSSAIEQLKKSTVSFGIANQPVGAARNHLFTAAAYRAKGMTDGFTEEMNEFEKIRETSYLIPWILHIAGKLYARGGEVERAVNVLQDLTSKMDENNKEDKNSCHVLKGEIETAKGNYDDAINQLEIACQLHRNIYTLESLAHAHFKNGDLDPAIAEYREIIETEILGWEGQEGWLRAHAQLGEIYEDLGDTENASRYYEKLLDIWKDADEDLPLLIDVKERLSKLK